MCGLGLGLGLGLGGGDTVRQGFDSRLRLLCRPHHTDSARCIACAVLPACNVASCRLPAATQAALAAALSRTEESEKAEEARHLDAANAARTCVRIIPLLPIIGR